MGGLFSLEPPIFTTTSQTPIISSSMLPFFLQIRLFPLAQLFVIAVLNSHQRIFKGLNCIPVV